MQIKRIYIFFTMVLFSISGVSMQAGLRGSSSMGDGLHKRTSPSDSENVKSEDSLPATGATEQVKESNAAASTPVEGKKSKKILSGIDGFIAGADWEFDGFVSGGQGQEIRSMFMTNDLLYLNVGLVQGIQPGDRVGIYKRGDRVRDPQSGKFIGYEVRRVAITEITDKVDEETCSARVIRTNDGIEIGDLVRRESIK